MQTLQLRTLLGRVAFAALLPLAITGCDDPVPGTSDGGTDTDPNDDDGTTDTATVTATATVTDTTPTTDTMTDTATDTTPDTDSTSDTETTDTETGDTDTTDTEGETEADTEGETEADTDTGKSECQQVTIDSLNPADNGGAQYTAEVSDLGGADPELFRVEFYTDGDDAFPAAGDIDLSAGDKANYATCLTCVRLFEDITPDTLARQYFQSEGTLGLSESPDTLTSELTFTGVRLVEVTIAADFTSTPVVDGACVDIVDGAFTPPPPAPDGWTCSDASYEDGATCDCGCGIADPDCADADATTCDECSGAGSCGETYDTCDVIVADDNTACSIPVGWTCDLAAYGDGATCDCGCGIVDSDCADALVATCASCNGTGSCAADEADCSTIDVDDNSTCDPTLLGWTCAVSFYGADDGCDCGCGTPDPDCGGDTTLAICDFCDDTDSCSTMACAGNTEIDPANNDVCL